MNFITLADSGNARKFYPGMRLVLTDQEQRLYIPYWWVELWQWLKRVLRRTNDGSLLVTAVNHETGVITVAGKRS